LRDFSPSLPSLDKCLLIPYNETMSTAVLGGPFNGFSTIQTAKGYRDTNAINTREIIKRSWTSRLMANQYTGNGNVQYGRIVTPFRAANNSGDYLGRVNYSCGGPNQINATYPGWKSLIGTIPQRCDGTGIPAASCNVKYVSDCSDLISYRRRAAISHNYNDLKDGGYQNSSYVAQLAVRRGF
jgi:hypothetical protein